jgi:hypothetical protein
MDQEAVLPGGRTAVMGRVTSRFVDRPIRTIRHGRHTLPVVAPRNIPSACPVRPHGAEEWLEPDAR